MPHSPVSWDGTGESRQGEPPATSPGTEGCAPQPEKIAASKSDTDGPEEVSTIGRETEDREATATSRKSASMEVQFEKLQERLVELEKRADDEKHRRPMMERRTVEVETRPIPALNLTDKIESYPAFPEAGELQIERRPGSEADDYLCADEKYSYHGENRGPPGNYLSRAINVLEGQLRSLRQQNDEVDNLQRHLGMKQMEWEKEREALLVENQMLKLLGAVGRRASEESIWNVNSQGTNDSQEALTDHGDRISSPPPPAPVYERAELNYGDWQHFQLPGRERFAVDVLEGEPPVSWEQWEEPSLKSIAPEESTKQRKSNGITKSTHVPGRAPLPERIRINSKHITKTLQLITGERLSTPLVMTRPYKMLAYYDGTIRSKLQELREKFAGIDPISDNATGIEFLRDPDAIQGPQRFERLEPVVRMDQNNERAYAPSDNSSVDEESDYQDEFTSSLTACQHLQCLVSFMVEKLHEKTLYLAARDPLYQTVTFGDIWYLFQLGDEVIDQNRRQVYRIMGISSAPHKRHRPRMLQHEQKARDEDDTPVTLSCVYLDFDGEQLGPKVREVKIARFDGERAVTALEVYPLRLAEARKPLDGQVIANGDKTSEKLTLRERFISRGRMFMNVTSFKHMHHSGLTLDTREEVDGHVVVDFEEAFGNDTHQTAGKFPEQYSEQILVQRTDCERRPDKEQVRWRPRLDNLMGQRFEESRTRRRSPCRGPCCRCPQKPKDSFYDDSYIDKKRNEDYINLLIPEDRHRAPSPSIFSRPLREIKGQKESLTEEDLLITFYRVFGFILRSRKWAQLSLDNLTLPKDALEVEGSNKDRDILKDDTAPRSNDVMGVFHGAVPETTLEDDTAFGQLVLPDGHKDMVRSLVAQHFRDKESARKESKEIRQVDIVRGKGKGLIILLHGAPGVGKTTTAEGLAELFRKPLFQITCGDLGTSAKEVEKALEMHFALANRWGCVLLLDEADVFLAARSKEDFKRNALVSVFLRVMEYYAGILFLTTNRVGDFDEAFASRIHISLYYPHLSLESTRAIFDLNLTMIKRRFVARGRKIDIEKMKILDFAEEYFKTHPDEKWNGRQIRNACQTALALAEYRAGSNTEVYLRVDELQTVSTAYLHFMEYLNKTRGQHAEKWAKALKLRARDIDLLILGESKPEDRNIGEKQAKVEKEGETKKTERQGATTKIIALGQNASSTAGFSTPSAFTTPQQPISVFSPPPPGPSFTPQNASSAALQIVPPAFTQGVPPAVPYAAALGTAQAHPYGAHYASALGYPPWPYSPPAPGYQAPSGPAQFTKEASLAWAYQQQQQQQSAQHGHSLGQAFGYGMPPHNGETGTD